MVTSWVVAWGWGVVCVGRAWRAGVGLSLGAGSLKGVGSFWGWPWLLVRALDSNRGVCLSRWGMQ